MPHARLVLVLAILFCGAACNRAPAPSGGSKDSQEPLKQYPMRGAVIRVDPLERLATIKSQKIEGWMEAMTMDYPVKDPADMAKIHPGQEIQATVFVQGLNYWVGGVQPAGAAPAAK